MFEMYYVLHWTYHYIDGIYYYSKSKRFETEAELNRFRLELCHRSDIEVVEWEKQYRERWKKG